MEHARIKSLCGLMDSVGFHTYVYEDFAEETFSVLRALGSALGSPGDDAALVGSFNSQDVSDSIVTHFKVALTPLCPISLSFSNRPWCCC